MGEINCLDEPCSVITVILSPLVRVPLSCLEKRARKEGKGGMCWVGVGSSQRGINTGTPWRSTFLGLARPWPLGKKKMGPHTTGCAFYTLQTQAGWTDRRVHGEQGVLPSAAADCTVLSRARATGRK